MQERVATPENGMVLAHSSRHDIGATHHVDWQALGCGKQFMLCRQDNARKITRNRENT